MSVAFLNGLGKLGLLIIILVLILAHPLRPVLGWAVSLSMLGLLLLTASLIARRRAQPQTIQQAPEPAVPDHDFWDSGDLLSVVWYHHTQASTDYVHFVDEAAQDRSTNHV